MPEGTARKRHAPPTPRAWRPFEVVGLELEYSIVDSALRPRCGVEALFAALSGRPTSDVELGPVDLSNELAAHVLELKTPPLRSLEHAEERVVRGLELVSSTLRDRFGWRLLPTGMHPFMKPSDTQLWSRANRRIYRAYAELFDIRSHGWLNVQSCQVNLPFGTEEEAVAMHNATACLLPYLPALAASSPFVEGKPGPALSNRMRFYGRNQARIPVLTGGVIPQFVSSLRQYRSDVLGAMYRALDGIRGGSVIRHEWVNSRGAILRFDRRAMEVRVLDLQECAKMDVAIACFVRRAVAILARQWLDGRIRVPDRKALLADYARVLIDGRGASIDARFLPGSRHPRTARGLLERLIDESAAGASAWESRALARVATRMQRGNLAERMRARVVRVRPASRRDAIRGLYAELQDALASNEPWLG